ncbi:hypothetical protein QFC22_000639 [Naganishia vaughanmartiniae]|uniref:Uncharacterized protein n=1 Tax=Naganishia vaughanmartiniae TaxID=1424756 RepID=A0ACC2XNY0_9TREE|nr:hypothetical protein QFC22_000639 [Naganishia vaughanmartiniae]
MSDVEGSPAKHTPEGEDDAMTSRAEEPPRGESPEISKAEASNALGDMFDDDRSDNANSKEEQNETDEDGDENPRPRKAVSGTPRQQSVEDDRQSVSSDGDMGRGGDSRFDNHRLEYEEEEEGVPLKREVIDAHVHLPDVPKLKGTDGQTWILRLPMGIGAPAEPYEPQLYKEAQEIIQEKEDAELKTEQERKRRAFERMYEVTNTVRWKWHDGSGGLPERKTNSRVIRWSDGSASLQVGQEIWDIDVPSGNTSKPFTSKAETKAESSAIADKKAKTEGSLSVLYGTEFDEKVLFADRVVNGYLGLIPATPNIRNYQKRLQALSGASIKQAKIRSYHDKSGIAPDKQAEMEVKRIQEQQRRVLAEKGVRYTGAMTSWRPGAAGMGSRGSSPRKRDRAGPSSGGASQRMGRERGMSSEEDERPGLAHHGGGGGYEKDGFVVEDEEDDDEYYLAGSRPKKKSKSEKTKPSRDFSDDDEDEEEEEEAEAEDSEGEASELEEAERAAEKAERERRKVKDEKRARDAPTSAVPGTSLINPVKLSYVPNASTLPVDDISDEELVSGTAPAKKRTVVVEDDDDE